MSGQWQGGYDPQKRPRNNDGQDSDEDKDADLFDDDEIDDSKEIPAKPEETPDAPE